ncbi:Gag-Pol polyprotein [Nymphon striatum]|nr:Gag-Pol polyprotein [Nymphon striatum]
MSTTDFVLSPVPMKSDDVLCEYLQYFSSIVDCNAWDDAKAAAYLRPLLGVGSHWLDDIAEKDLKSFKAICSALGDQQVPFREARCLDLMTLHMDRNETVYKFKGRVSELVEACYGGFAARNKQQLIRDFFLHRLSPDLKAAVLNTQASKLDEVVSAALMAESLRPSRAPGVPVSARIKSKGSITCFYCRKPGHVRSSCPKLSATFSKPPSDVQKFRQKTAMVSSVDVSPRFLIPVKIQNSLQYWLLDCGGQTSCLPNSMFFADMPVSSNVRVRAANGKCMNISGMRNLHFMIGNHSFEHSFTVVELPGLPILGMDLLRKMEATVDFNKGTLVFGDGETLCLTSEHDHPLPSEPDFSFKTVSPNNDSSLCSDSIHERVDEDDETSNWFIEVSRVETDCLLTASDVLQEFQDNTDGRGDVGVDSVHLEKLNNLETDSFLNSIRRFMARRGPVTDIYSDNATNFVGGATVLNNRLKSHTINWHFITPNASHMGGVWERLIRTVRRVLTAILANEIRLTDEILDTVLCEAESIVNSRPLTNISDLPNDLQPLTPNHLLLLREGVKLPSHIPTANDRFRQRYRYVQHLASQFWHRWTREYLVELQGRVKWTATHRNLTPGDLVLLVSPAPRNSWPLGLVKEVYPGKDGLVRTVKVATRTSEFIRPVVKVVLLESVDD